MKKLAIIIALFIGVSTVSFSQADKVKKAKKTATSGTPEYPADFTLAMTLIDEALQNEETKNLAETWYVKGLVYSEMFDAEQFKLYPNRPDINVQIEAAYKAYMNWLVADSLDVIETANNPKSKGKMRFRKDIGDRMARMYILMGAYGDKLFNERDFAGAKKAYDDFLNFPKADLLKETSRKINAQDSAFYYANLNAETALKVLTQDQMIEKDTVGFLKSLEEGMTRFPNNAFFIENKIQYDLNMGNEKEALDKINKAIEVNPNNYNSLYIRGFVQSLNPETYEAAKSDFQRAIDLKPDYSEAISAYGTVLVSQGDEFYNKSFDMKSAAESTAAMNEANKLYEQAVTYYEKARAIDNTNDELLRKLQNLYRKLKKYDKEKEIKAIRDTL